MRDFFISLVVSLAINSYIAYISLKNGIPIYFDHDEVIWMKTLVFCGGEFAFFEQKWGLIVPILCVLYPLKLVFHQDYFPLFLRFVMVFFNCLLILKILRIILKNEEVILFTVLAHFSYFIGVPSSPFHLFNIIRIFSPSIFMIPFLTSYIFFINLLNSERFDKHKIFYTGLFLGIVFYSSSHWILYLLLTISLMIVYLAFFKEYNSLRSLFYVLLIGFLVGLPAIAFNYFQLGFLKESLTRGGYFVKGAGYEIPQEFLIFLIFFVFSFSAFILSRNFSRKNIFIVLASTSGLLLAILDFLSVLPFSTLLYHHITFPFNYFNRILLGFLLEKISSSFRLFGKFLLFFIFIFFIFSWFRFFVFFFSERREPGLQEWAWDIIKVDLEHQRKLRKVSEWIKINTSEDSVIVFEGKRSSIIKYAELFDELKVSLMAGRYAFHSIINFFSDMSDQEVFERFLLREKLLGRKKEEVADLYNISSAFSAWGGHKDLSFGFGKALFGLPPGIEPSNYFGSLGYQDLLKDFVRTISELFSDDQYISELMKRYKVNYVIRKKPPSEEYFRYIGEIEDLYILQFVGR